MAVTERAPRARALAPADLYDVDELLGDDERLIRDTVRAFVREQALPIIAAHFEAGTFPRELVPGLAELGVLGMHLRGYGCAGASAMAYGVACEELEAGDSGLRSFVSVQGSLAMFPIWAYGSKEQKLRWLPEMAAGRAIGCFGLSEPDAGSDPSSMRTVARRDGADWVIDGTKMWITNGSMADVAVVWAMTDAGVRGFLVERGTRGFTTSDVHNKLSLRASVTSELSFDGVRLPDSAVLPEVTGMRGPLSCLNEARYGIGWGAMGAAMACYDTALQYAKTRKQFDNKPIASHQLVQEKLAWMITEIVKGQLLALHVGRIKDDGKVDPSHISMLKMNNVAIALDIARKARDILGANGIVDDYCVMRHMNNLESVYTYEGTNDIHKLVIGEKITGISAFS